MYIEKCLVCSMNGKIAVFSHGATTLCVCEAVCVMLVVMIVGIDCGIN